MLLHIFSFLSGNTILINLRSVCKHWKNTLGSTKNLILVPQIRIPTYGFLIEQKRNGTAITIELTRLDYTEHGEYYNHFHLYSTHEFGPRFFVELTKALSVYSPRFLSMIKFHVTKSFLVNFAAVLEKFPVIQEILFASSPEPSHDFPKSLNSPRITFDDDIDATILQRLAWNSANLRGISSAHTTEGFLAAKINGRSSANRNEIRTVQFDFDALVQNRRYDIPTVRLTMAGFEMLGSFHNEYAVTSIVDLLDAAERRGKTGITFYWQISIIETPQELKMIVEHRYAVQFKRRSLNWHTVTLKTKTCEITAYFFEDLGRYVVLAGLADSAKRAIDHSHHSR
ncbi:hypothetical protein PFISCL1PPCAC_28165 [Pristionchus fissidentatus]|uniref:F-box domain-containing protein n=1 Tax=Pristionchus fissidentatus TaxID=1538716 RepID=A0AAV5X2P3_9BILA|nr:hypothetical protein PFISCL1PPCAC_28165 [Pristionchus fissidentatus]